MRLNLGCGDKPIDGYINLDVKQGDEIFPLLYQNVDVIRAVHILEHFGMVESISVLSQWVSCLKVGGIIKIGVPDFDDLVRRYKLGEDWPIESILMGGQVDDYDYHKSIWTLGKLRFLMENLGLTDIQTWQSEIVDCASYNFSLNLQGRKI